MNGSTPSSGDLASATENESKRRSSAPASSLALQLAPASISSERRSTSQGGRFIKTTSFDKVIVYEFELTLGDNPAVREGCPVALGRECIYRSVVDLESFEQSQDQIFINVDGVRICIYRFTIEQLS